VLKHVYDETLSNFAFNFNLRRYIKANAVATGNAMMVAGERDVLAALGRAVYVDPMLTLGSSRLVSALVAIV